MVEVGCRELRSTEWAGLEVSGFGGQPRAIAAGYADLRTGLVEGVARPVEVGG